MVLAKVTGILSGEVHLVVVRTNHLTAQNVTVVQIQGIEIAGIQIIKCSIVTAGRRVEVATATIATSHLIECEA